MRSFKIRRQLGVLLSVVITLAASGSTAEAAKQVYTKSEVLEVQSLLTELGYRLGPIDGNFTDQTSNQVWFFLIDEGIEPSRHYGDNFLKTALTHLRAVRDRSRQPETPKIFLARNHELEVVTTSPNDHWAATSDEKSVKIWDLRSGAQVESIDLVCCATALEFTPDSRHLAISTNGPAVRLWSLEHGRYDYSMAVSSDDSSLEITGIKFRPGTDEVVIAASDGFVRLFDWKQQRELKRLGPHGFSRRDEYKSRNVVALAVSPDGSSAVTIGWGVGDLRIWDLVSRKQRHRLSLFRATTKTRYSLRPFLYYSADGRIVVGRAEDSDFGRNDKGKLFLVDAASGKRKSVRLKSSLGGFFVDPSGTAAVAGIRAPSDDKIKWRKFDLASGRIGEVLLENDEETFVYLPASDRILTSLDSRFVIRKAKPSKSLNSSQPALEIRGLSDCPDDRTLLIGIRTIGDDEAIVVWDKQTGRLVRTFMTSSDEPATDKIHCLPSGHRVLTSTEEGDISIWNYETGKRIRVLSAPWTKLEDKNKGTTVSVDGRYAVLSRGGGLAVPIAGSTKDQPGERPEMNILDLETGKYIRRIPLRRLTKKATALQRVNNRNWIQSRPNFGEMGFTDAGTYLVASRSEWRFAMWEVATGRRVRTFSTDLGYRVFFPKFKANTAKDRQLVLGMGRQAAMVSSVMTPPESDEIFVAVGAQYVASTPGYKKFMLVFDPHSGNLKRTIETVPSARLEAVDPRGQRLASATDTALYLYDTQSGELIKSVPRSKGDVESLVFGRDSSRLYVVGRDNVLRVRDAKTGGLLASSVLFPNGEWVTMTPEGFFAGSERGAALLALKTGPLQFTSINQVYQALYRPDLLREKLAGDLGGKVKTAAANLDLQKIVGSGSAPTISILSPKGGTAVDDDKLTMQAKITDQGGGIGRIEWRVNGLTLGVQSSRGFKRVTDKDTGAQAATKSITMRQDLWLDPGDNVIEIVVYNAKNLVASEPVQIKVNWAGDTSKTPPRLHVLAIGVNDYFDSRLRLNYAVSDAKAISGALKKAGAEIYESVSVTTVLEDQVTATGLEKAFAEMKRQVRPRDVFVFFLAGHGKTVDGKYYFIPQDFRYNSPQSIIEDGIGQDKWQAWFSTIRARKSILLYDTCESGSLTGQRIATRGMERVAALEKLTRAMGRSVLSAATDDAPALEGYKGHGVFTHALLEALSNSDANANQLIEVTELAGYVDAQVPEISHKAFGMRQIPQMNIVGSNFPLVKQTASFTSTASNPIVATIPTKPTHVIINPADLFAAAGGVGRAISKLKPGTLVTLIETDEGWGLVARNGEKLGYIAEANLLAAQ